MATPENQAGKVLAYIGAALAFVMALGGIAWVVLVWRWVFKGTPCG